MEYWKFFWKDYRNTKPNSEDDLIFQVGKTINKIPLSKKLIEEIVLDIEKKLNLNNDDVLLEICCGNGIITNYLSNNCKFIYAFDFTEHLINAAIEFKAAENIIYKTGNAKEDFFRIFELKDKPNKFLLNDALAYFEPNDLEKIVKRILDNSKNFSLYITQIPSDELKYNFYNTPERVFFYEQNLKNGDISNNGIGRWWKEQELISIAEKLNIKYKIIIPDEKITNFRINILFQSK